jgi:hypothetical protein
LSNLSFALTDGEKQCIRVCCLNADGIYHYDSNGCENSTNFDTKCADDCLIKEKPGVCPGPAFLLMAVLFPFIAKVKP